MDLARDATAIGALADPTRRSLYRYVVTRDQAVGREQAATALGLAQHTVSFHLDRLVDEGILDVEYRRLTGRTGPGAGRPSKLYRRSERQFAASLPPRRYDLVGEILADAVATATSRSVPLREALDEAAHAMGVQVAGESGAEAADPLDALSGALSAQGYEPRRDGSAVEFTTCPFDRLATKHAELVCCVNHRFVQGVADGLGQGVVAELRPGSGGCCVRSHAAPDQR